MYNRYVPNDKGTYTRVETPSPTPPPQSTAVPEQGEKEPSVVPPPLEKKFSLKQTTDGLTGVLRAALDKVQLQDIDTGDLMVLALLFFLFREDADEEVLFALGLMLIL